MGGRLLVVATNFESFPKIPRYKGVGVVITEKIDGTSAQVYIDDEGNLWVGSRSRWITPQDDNYGFARFVLDHEEQCRQLGPGRHFGEWWGCGIQRGYNEREKIFSLFNIHRADDVSETTGCDRIRTVPVLYEGPFTDFIVAETMRTLAENGSVASPKYVRPEGIVIYFPSARTRFKWAFDDAHKGKQR
jgi:hypothetical protein